MTQKMEGKQLRRLSPSEEWDWGVWGTQRPLGAFSRGPTSWLINPIKSLESIGAPGASSPFLPGRRATTGSVMIHVPPSAFGLSSHLHLAGWQGGRDRTGCPPRQDNRTGRGKEKRCKWSREERRTEEY